MEILIGELDWLIFIIKIILSIICGFVIGMERETRGKPAGIKTHTLICLGSCLFTHFSLMATNGDPTRIAAQVVSGIGFIGAGTIMQSKQRIEGLTSAALVFVISSIGMLIGGSHFIYSIIATISILILFQIIKRNKFQTKINSYRLYIKCNNYDDLKSTVDFIEKLNCKITNKKVEKKPDSLELSISYLTTPLTSHRIISKLYQLKEVQSFTQV